MRDHLNALVLASEKTGTAGLWKDEYGCGAEALEEPGERQVLLDSSGGPLAIVEIVRIETHPFVAVPWEFAEAEGEGFNSVEEWRDGHRSYYATQGVCVGDDDRVVCVWFRVVERL